MRCFVFSIFAVAIIIGIFLFELRIRGSGILKSLGVVLGNVSSVLSGSTLLTIFEVNLMFFRRAREERAKLKAERKQFKVEKEVEKELVEELKKSNETLRKANEELRQAASDAGLVPPNTGNTKSNNTASQPQPKQSTKPKN